jgi:hypothetical protein
MPKPQHWFSRRHETNGPHIAAQEAKQAKVEEYFATFAANQKARALRSPQEQLALIATRRGESKKERARLLRQIESAK